MLNRVAHAHLARTELIKVIQSVPEIPLVKASLVQVVMNRRVLQKGLRVLLHLLFGWGERSF